MIHKFYEEKNSDIKSETTQTENWAKCQTLQNIAQDYWKLLQFSRFIIILSQ